MIGDKLEFAHRSADGHFGPLRHRSWLPRCHGRLRRGLVTKAWGRAGADYRVKRVGPPARVLEAMAQAFRETALAAALAPPGRPWPPLGEPRSSHGAGLSG